MKLEIKYIVDEEGAKDFNAMSNGNLALNPNSYALTVCAHDDKDIECGTHPFNDYSSLMEGDNTAPCPEMLMYNFISEKLLTGLKGKK